MSKAKKLISMLWVLILTFNMTIPAFATSNKESTDIYALENTLGYSEDNPINLEKISEEGSVITYAADLETMWIPMNNGIERISTLEPFYPKAVAHIDRVVGTVSVELQVSYIGSLRTTIKSGKCQFIKTYGAMGDKSNDNISVSNAFPPLSMITFKSIFVLNSANAGQKQYVSCGECALTLKTGDRGTAPPVYMTITLE